MFEEIIFAAIMFTIVVAGFWVVITDKEPEPEYPITPSEWIVESKAYLDHEMFMFIKAPDGHEYIIRGESGITHAEGCSHSNHNQK